MSIVGRVWRCWVGRDCIAQRCRCSGHSGYCSNTLVQMVDVVMVAISRSAGSTLVLCIGQLMIVVITPPSGATVYPIVRGMRYRIGIRVVVALQLPIDAAVACTRVYLTVHFGIQSGPFRNMVVMVTDVRFEDIAMFVRIVVFLIGQRICGTGVRADRPDIGGG